MPTPDLLLRHASLFRGSGRPPALSRIALAAGRIHSIEDESDVGERRFRELDCQGATVLPGFVDAHLHLFSYAAALAGIDCSPRFVRSIAQLKTHLAARAAPAKPNAWLRAWGYDDFALQERRHPTRWDLDAAIPDRPLKLIHRSGHITVLNSAAMQLLGITLESDEPDGGVIERDTHGEPNGIFLEMEEDLERRGLPALSERESEDVLQEAFGRLLSYGVTSVHEATPTRALPTWDCLAYLRERSKLSLRLFKLFGHADLPELKHRGLAYGSGDDWLRVGPIKVMLNETIGAVLPAPAELRATVGDAVAQGFPVAFHAVEERGIAAALDAVRQLTLTGARHRLEHCGLCPPALLRRLAASGMAVVTQPAFVAESGDRYLATVPKAKQPWLYRVAALREAGIPVAFGSDCPVASPDPLAALQAATTRLTRGGAALGAAEAVSIEQALELYSQAGARLSGEGQLKGWLAPGMLADIVVLNGVIETLEPSELHALRVEKTIVGGELAWER